MLLTYTELVTLVNDGVITNVKPDQINGASVDLTLADGFMKEAPSRGIVRLGAKQTPEMMAFNGQLILAPGEFALAATEQIFNLPNDIAAIYVLKSSMARAGLNHLNAGYCDPGWNGSALTMEFHNTLQYHTLALEPGGKCGQIYLFRGDVVPELASYAVKGQYNGQQSVQESKGIR